MRNIIPRLFVSKAVQCLTSNSKRKFLTKTYLRMFSHNIRGNFKTVTSKDIDFFHSLLGFTGVIQNADELKFYNTDWLKSHEGVLQCQAGCVLESLENFVNERSYTIPVDLGAKGTCQIGGNISTNAGGLRFIRYGSLHGNILGLKAVLPNGEILNCMNTMRKNNTGYDLKHLFIGSEGTLGVVTEAAILCYPKSAETAVAFLGCNSFDQVLSTAKVVRQKLPEVLSSLEMLDNQAADTSKYLEIWAIRERITEALLQEGCGYKYDISLPLADFYEIVEVMRERLGEKVTRCVAYGHLGDGNLHFNATTRQFDPEVFSLIEPFIYDWTSRKNGSISAEHGIGYKKYKYLQFNNTESAISVMKSLKTLFDPSGILNPYKVLP